MSRRGWGDDWPPRAKPRRPADGIKAQTKRGAFASGWWAQRWIAVLEGLAMGARLARGRSYARSGQVTQITIEVGSVRAQVQGSRVRPYDVTIRMRELDPSAWTSVGTAIADNVRLSTALLAGEMPADIEAAFASAGESLFPTSMREIKTACSCPDSSNPCKHIAAVFYLIGEEFDRDPFLLFVLRGRAHTAVRELFAPAGIGDLNETTAALPANSVSSASFWGDDDSAGSEKPQGEMTPQTFGQVAVLARAGNFPFWRGDGTLADAIGPMYRAAASFALEWLADHADP